MVQKSFSFQCVDDTPDHFEWLTNSVSNALDGAIASKARAQSGALGNDVTRDLRNPLAINFYLFVNNIILNYR